MHSDALTVARETLRELASKKLPPTPDNYTRTYFEIASPGTRIARLAPTTILRDLVEIIRRRHPATTEETVALERAIETADWDRVKTALSQVLGADNEAGRFGVLWCKLIGELVRQWETHTPGVTRARKRDALAHVLSTFSGSPELLYARLHGMVGAWSAIRGADADTSVETAGDVPQPTVKPQPDPAADEKTAALVRELLANTLTFGVVERLGYPFELAREARELAALARDARTPEAVAQLGTKLKHLWVELEIRGDDQHKIQQCLLRLLNTLCGNVSDLVGDDAWLRGQLTMIAMLADGPIDLKTMEELERSLREVVFRQSTLKQSLDQAKDALKDMATTLIDRLGAMADSAGGYHDRLSGYATRIERAERLPELFELVAEVMRDTRSAQTNIQRSRDELLEARMQVEACQNRIGALQKELLAVSDRLHEDHLTALPNRRGLARAYEVEASRADRRQSPLCLAMLDIDNFKALNDSLGHRAGDLALMHLTSVVQKSIRPSDVLARYGGEEFVILLPETPLDMAVQVMTRVQRDLTRQFFLHDNKGVLITFSAGVAQRVPGELQDDLVGRADRALYAAKQAGKNRVVTA